jgi:hypothetical protein
VPTLTESIVEDAALLTVLEQAAWLSQEWAAEGLHRSIPLSDRTVPVSGVFRDDPPTNTP